MMFYNAILKVNMAKVRQTPNSWTSNRTDSKQENKHTSVLTLKEPESLFPSPRRPDFKIYYDNILAAI
jgi:hypothetical protein